MREIKRERLIEERDILLFDILEELKKITKLSELGFSPESFRSDVTTSGYSNSGTPIMPVGVTTSAVSETKLFKCKYCGDLHEHSWQIAQCGKKNKKKEG